MKSIKEIPEQYLNKIISVAYGDASFWDKIKIYFDALGNTAVKEILYEYKETSKQVHMISYEEYQGEIPVKFSNTKAWIFDNLYIFFKRPIISTAMVLMIIGGAVGYFIINSGHSSPQYTEQELRIADQQAKESFALVASIFDRTKNELKNKIFNEKVNKPINKGLTIVYKYL
jgi:hypothetical protein